VTPCGRLPCGTPAGVTTPSAPPPVSEIEKTTLPGPLPSRYNQPVPGRKSAETVEIYGFRRFPGSFRPFSAVSSPILMVLTWLRPPRNPPTTRSHNYDFFRTIFFGGFSGRFGYFYGVALRGRSTEPCDGPQKPEFGQSNSRSSSLIPLFVVTHHPFLLSP